MFNFNIIEFVESKTVGIIPKARFLENDMTKCFYPPDKNYKKEITSEYEAERVSNWKVFQCRLLSVAGNLEMK